MGFVLTEDDESASYVRIGLSLKERAILVVRSVPITHKLRPYQVEAGRAILDSVVNHKGLTCSVEIARQGGKNELSAQLEVLLLTLFSASGGDAVKCSPTFRPQALLSMGRLRDRLNDVGYAGFWKSEHGYIFRLGQARQVFLSAGESSNVVGQTAHILLEVDESQDVDAEKFDKEFRPMGSSTNVTTVHYGTAWDDRSLLEQVKQVNLELERRDGVRRHFEYDWQEVAKHNPAYLRYVESERERLGAHHPLFLTQYCLKPIAGGGGFLNASQRAQLQGTHARRSRPDAGAIYIAGIDLAGESEVARDDMLRALRPRKDSTVVTIAELSFPSGSDIERQPSARIVEHYWWTGQPHTSLYQRLVDLLKNVWRCRRVVVDATGVGEGVAAFLREALGASVVTPFRFDQRSKSELGFKLLAAVNSGRLKMCAQDGSEEHKEFWKEVERARSFFRPNQTMGFMVDPAEGHDDFLMSLALLAEAMEYRTRSARGSTRDDYEIERHSAGPAAGVLPLSR